MRHQIPAPLEFNDAAANVLNHHFPGGAPQMGRFVVKRLALSLSIAAALLTEFGLTNPPVASGLKMGSDPGSEIL
jgi:hypothetical protein